jgi:hypothetical protein
LFADARLWLVRLMILVSGLVYKKSALCQQVKSSMDNSLANRVTASSLAVGSADSWGRGPSRRWLRARPGIFRAAPRLEAEPCARQSPVWSDDHAQGRRRSAGGGGNARRWRYEEGGEPFFGRARCGAPCLAPDWDEEALESRGAPNPEGGSTPECGSKPERGVEVIPHLI